MVDWCRESVTDYIRPWADSPLEVKRRWYRVPWGTPTLGLPTVFMSPRYEPFPYLERGAGPVWPSFPDYSKRRTPSGLKFTHVCGTSEDFAGQALFDPTVHVEYDDEWIPDCCDRVRPPMSGGIDFGSNEVGDVFSAADPTEGGLLLGGAAGDVFGFVDATEGGLEIGGEGPAPPIYSDPTEGGSEIGGEAGDVLGFVDAAEGGSEIGGEVGDVLGFVDATEGGSEIGGEVGDDYTPGGAFTDPTEGGLQIGGAAGDLIRFLDPTEGGLQIGGATGDQWRVYDPTGGGLQIGGATGDKFSKNGVYICGVTHGSYASASDIVLPPRQAGDTLLVIVAHNPNTTPTANTGWTLRRQAGISIVDVYHGGFSRVSDGVDSTPPFTLTPSGGGIYIAITICSSLATWFTQTATGNSATPTAGNVFSTTTLTLDVRSFVSAVTSAPAPTMTPAATHPLLQQQGKVQVTGWNANLQVDWAVRTTSGNVGAVSVTSSSSSRWAALTLAVGT